jgi:hypothetical protein
VKASGQIHEPAVFTAREDARGTYSYWIGDLVSPRAGVEALEKGTNFPLPRIEPLICLLSKLLFAGRHYH